MLRAKKSQRSLNSRRTNNTNSKEPSHLSPNSTSSKPRVTTRKNSTMKRKRSAASSRIKQEKSSSLPNPDQQFMSYQHISKPGSNVGAVEFHISNTNTPIQGTKKSSTGSQNSLSHKSGSVTRDVKIAQQSATIGSLHLLGQFTETENGSQSTMECQLPFRRLSTGPGKHEPSFINQVPSNAEFVVENLE